MIKRINVEETEEGEKVRVKRGMSEEERRGEKGILENWKTGAVSEEKKMGENKMIKKLWKWSWGKRRWQEKKLTDKNK